MEGELETPVPAARHEPEIDAALRWRETLVASLPLFEALMVAAWSAARYYGKLRLAETDSI